jgi:hypothetical protein
VSQTPATADPAERRPTALLLVYCWDLFLALLAVFGALAALGGAVELGGTTKAVPLGLEILGALSSAAYAAVLAIVASLLTRRRRWIQRMQILVMSLAIALALLSLLVAAVTGGGIDVAELLVTILFLLIDAAAILAMTEKRVAAWYTEDAAVPWYAWGTTAFWAATALALVVLDAVI